MTRSWLHLAAAALAMTVGCYQPGAPTSDSNVSQNVPPSGKLDLGGSGAGSTLQGGGGGSPSASATPTSSAPVASAAGAPSETDTAAPVATPAASASVAAPASTAKPTPTTIASARPIDRFTPPDRGLPPELRAAAEPPRPSRSPRAAASGTKPNRTRVLAAPESGGGVTGISFDDLVFDILPDQEFDPAQLNDAVRSLFDRRIKIRGFIVPGTMLHPKGNTHFILVRDDKDCCFGPGAALYDCIRVQMTPGHTADFRAIPVAVTGTLRFKPYRDFEGVTRAVFALEADAVE